ncbi:MAG: GC-type dockerin domain-anchored protein, partial [Phycisphaerales bacterium]
RIASSGLPGDVNGDGAVDLADLNLVLANFGTNNPAGDANGDGVVDLADLNLVLANFGSTAG